MKGIVLLLSLVFVHLSTLAQSDYSEIAKLLEDGKLQEAESALNLKVNGQSPEYFKHVGALFLRKGQSQDALDNLQKSLDLLTDKGQARTLLASKIIGSLGIAQWSLGNNSLALQYALQSLSIRKEKKSSDALMAAAFNDLGLIYSNSDAEIALENYEKAKNLYVKEFGDSNDKVAQALTNIGIIQSQTEAYQDAIVSFFEALAIWTKLYPQGHPNEAFVYANIGQTHFESGNLKGAREYQLKALDLYKKAYGNKHPDLANVYNAIGRIHIRENNFKEGLASYQQAIIANIKSFNSLEVNSNPELSGYFNPSVLLNSLIYKAEGLEALYYNKTVKFSDLKLGLATVDLCDQLIDKIRHTRKNEQDKVALGSATSRLYKVGVRTAYTMSELGVDKNLYLEKAFHYAEKSKSAVLLDAVADSKAKTFANIPQAELLKEDALKSKITFLEQQLIDNANDDDLRKNLFDVSRQYDDFVSTLEKQYPTYYNLKYNVAIPTVREIQSKLDEDAMLLSYFLDDENKRLYSFSISHNSFKVFNGSLTKNFDRYTAGLRNSIYYHNRAIFTLTAVGLYKILFPLKTPSNINKLIIIPSGKLGYIPFEALLTKKPKKGVTKYSEYNFLIKEKAISYTYSSLLFYQSEERQYDKASILLFAPIEFDESLVMLPNTRREINTIAADFEKVNNRTNVYLGKDASENRVKEVNLKDYNYLHFATHGVVDERQPDQSRIYLSPTEGEDGRLLCSEIYNLELDADLVSLSACETGLGKIAQGEGIMGFTRALMYSGAKNTLVSLWSVSDESTADLMIDFYKNIVVNKTHNYQQSLQMAKLKMISSEKKASPFYWAPFILIGE